MGDAVATTVAAMVVGSREDIEACISQCFS